MYRVNLRRCSVRCPATLQSAPAVLDVTDAVVGMYAGGGNQLVLALPSAACAIPPDGVVLTVLAMSNSQLERSGSWEAYDSFTNAAVYVNTFNGALQLEVNCLTSAGNLLPTTNSLLYFSYASGSSYPFTANGWILNVHETVSLDTSGTLLYYDDCYNQRRIYQSEAPPADPYDVVRYTSQTGPDYIEYTATSKQAVFQRWVRQQENAQKRLSAFGFGRQRKYDRIYVFRHKADRHPALQHGVRAKRKFVFVFLRWRQSEKNRKSRDERIGPIRI